MGGPVEACGLDLRYMPTEDGRTLILLSLLMPGAGPHCMATRPCPAACRLDPVGMAHPHASPAQDPLHYPHGTKFLAPGPLGQCHPIPGALGRARSRLFRGTRAGGPRPARSLDGCRLPPPRAPNPSRCLSPANVLPPAPCCRRAVHQGRHGARRRPARTHL